MNNIFLSKKHLHNRLLFLPAISLLLFSFFCDKASAPEEKSPSVLSLELSAPSSGNSYSVTDTIALFHTADRDSFTSKIYKEFSLDSGRMWYEITEIRSLNKNENLLEYESDTTYWTPSSEIIFNNNDFLDCGVLLRVRDYDKLYITISDYIHFEQ